MTIAFICAFFYSRYKYRHFKIVKATRRTWITDKTGDITTYRIQVLTKTTSEELQLDELWIENRLFKVRLIKKENNASARHFSEKETLYIEAERETKNVGFEEFQPSNRGKISVGYMIKNKRKYLSIKGFEEHDAKLSFQGQG